MKKIRLLNIFSVLLLIFSLFSACKPTQSGGSSEPVSAAASEHTLTQYAPYFDFTDDYGQQYLLIYVGEGKSLSALRETFERDKLSDFTPEQLAEFEVCDLGGDSLVLLVPRYEGLRVWINRIDYQGDAMFSGEELARFSYKPVYIYCSFSERMPDYEIHVSFDEAGHFFTSNEALLDSIK